MKSVRFVALLLLAISINPASSQAASRVIVTYVSALQGMTSSPGQYITITCYHAALPNSMCAGGGDFDRGTCGTDTDNGATVLQDNVTPTKNCYYRKNWGLNGVIDARQCGVYGDGVNDDYQALNNCLSYALPTSSRPGYSAVSTGGGQLYASGSIVIPQGVTLTCGAKSAFAQIVNNDYSGVQSAIWLREDSGGSDGQTISTDSTATHVPTGVAGIDGCVILRGTSSTSPPYDYSPTKVYPKSLRDSINETAAFRGTAITADGDGFSVTNTTILGFSQCWKTAGNVSRVVLDHVICDGTSGLQVNGGGGGMKLDNLNAGPLLTGSGGCPSCNDYVWFNNSTPATDNLYDIEQDGSGYALLLDVNNSKGPNYLPVQYDTIWVVTSSGRYQSAAGRYYIGSAPTTPFCGGHTCLKIHLDGSIYSDSGTPRTGTATWTAGTNVLTDASIDVTTLAVGMNVGSSISGCFANNTAITDINPAWNTIWISKPSASSCSGMASNIQFWDNVPSPTPTYPNTVTATLSGAVRTGDAYSTFGSAGVTISNCFTQNHFVSFHVGDTSNLTRFVNCATAMTGDITDDSIVGLLCDGQHEGSDCSQTEWANGVLGQHGAGSIVVNSDSTHGVHIVNAGVGPSGNKQTGRFADVNGGALSLANTTSELPGNLFVSKGMTFISLARQSPGGTAWGTLYLPGDVVTMSGGMCSVTPQITIDSVDSLVTGVPTSWHQSVQGVCSSWPGSSPWTTTTNSVNGSGAKGNNEDVTASLSMSNVVTPKGNLYLQGATAVASTNGCGNIFAKPTAYLCAPASVVAPPGGRLTLTSTAPVMTADVSGASQVYYAPYTGQQVPIYNSQSGCLLLSI